MYTKKDNLKNPVYYLEFFIRSFLGFEKIVQMLIDRGANVNAVDEDNTSAIIFAANKGRVL